MSKPVVIPGADLAFPVRVYDHLTLGTNAKGEQTYTGTYVEFMRHSSEPMPVTLDDVMALLKKHVKGKAALTTILDKPRLGDKAKQVREAVEEMAAHADAGAWKADKKYAKKTGTVVASDDAPKETPK